MHRLALLVAALLLAAGACLPTVAAQTRKTSGDAAAQAARRALARTVSSWFIQYRHINVAEIEAMPVDLAVVDWRPDPLFGTEWPFHTADVRRMQRKPDGGRRLLLAYLSIGEAEDYRWYWKRTWTEDPTTRPPWIGQENPRWAGNYPVRFWEAAWESILFGSPEAYLDRLIAAGYDGVYLDRTDVYQELTGLRRDSEAAMAGLLVRLARYAHQHNPRFLVVLQNAEELTLRRDVREAIDVQAKEDLFFGIDHDGRRNGHDVVDTALKLLRPLRRAGIPILLIEYPRDAASAAEIRVRAAAEQLTPLLAERALDTPRPVYPKSR